MDTSRERDESIERLLRQSLRTPHDAAAADSCLDAETLAAWIDGGLSGAALEMAQSHVADCARCQSLVGALARTNALVSQPEAEPGRAARRWLAWLVPLAAAATAVALWVAVPRNAVAPAPVASDVERQIDETKAKEPASLDDRRQAPLARNAPAAAADSSNVEGQAPARELRKEAAADLKEDAVLTPAAAPPAAPAAPPPLQSAREDASAPASAARARSANALAETVGVEIASPDPSVRWRIAGSVVERSTNGGSTWNVVPTSIAAELTAGAAPSTSVVWVVGRGGVVLLSTDGQTWRRIPFPEITDLSAVRANDARTASVTTSDGRVLSTSDGGVTWTK